VNLGKNCVHLINVCMIETTNVKDVCVGFSSVYMGMQVWAYSRPS